MILKMGHAGYHRGVAIIDEAFGRTGKKEPAGN